MELQKTRYDSWLNKNNKKMESYFIIGDLNYETIFPPKEGIEIRIKHYGITKER